MCWFEGCIIPRSPPPLLLDEVVADVWRSRHKQWSTPLVRRLMLMGCPAGRYHFQIRSDRPAGATRYP